MMQFLTTRVRSISHYLSELVHFGLPRRIGSGEREVLFILDGVGGFQFVPLLVRKMLRAQGIELATVYVRWQCGLPGEIWTDLMWHRRNRVMGAKLARDLLRHRRRYPDSHIHILACSGGAGVGVFALESLRGRDVIDTLILACPALSPTYDLSAALRCVKRSYAMVSGRDRVILGWGTRLLGTTDRKRSFSAGCLGFRFPAGISSEDRAVYHRLHEVRWTPELAALGHYGGHTGWAALPFLREHLIPLLRGDTALQLHPVPPWC